MFAAQDPGAVTFIALVIATAVVFFWRTVIKLIAIGIVVLVALGFLELLQGLH
jgi:hypothetical protein